MPLQPAVLEMGMGIDLHGQNYTLAATRAVWNAVHQSSLM
ncbi:MAG: Lin0512 family protein, partial [Chloroflexi bacterium]|nr:Lin0512 family protein [Chloroflexota bacterium]